MKMKILISVICLLSFFPVLQVNAANTDQKLKGQILIQVESHGEAWYVEPNTGEKYYMADGNEAYNIMRNLGIGITNKNLEKIKNSAVLALKQKGKIFLQVESKGEAYYVDFSGKLHYLKDGDSAYTAMRDLGLGITNKNLEKIKTSSKSGLNNSSTNTATPDLSETSRTKLMTQAKNLVSDSINESNKAIADSTYFIDLINNRKNILNSDITKGKESLSIISEGANPNETSLIKLITTLNKLYENDLADIQEYEDTLIKTREVFSSQLVKMNSLNASLDNSQTVSSYPYQEVINTLNEEKVLYSNASSAIKKNLETFKSTTASNDAQYKTLKNAIIATIDILNTPIPSSNSEKTSTRCYINSTFNGSVSSMDCY